MLDCPVCEFRLRGSPKEGYRCIRCHAVFSQGHVRAMRKDHFRGVIRKHFDAQEVLAEEENAAIDLAVRESGKYLEDHLPDEYAMEQPTVDPRMVHEFFEKRRNAYFSRR